jgi:hypothetical protein
MAARGSSSGLGGSSKLSPDDSGFSNKFFRESLCEDPLLSPYLEKRAQKLREGTPRREVRCNVRGQFASVRELKVGARRPDTP